MKKNLSIVGGVFRETKSFGESILNRSGGSNGFIAKFEMSGKMKFSGWVQKDIFISRIK